MTRVSSSGSAWPDGARPGKAEWGWLLAVATLALAIGAAYSDALHGPFTMDDHVSIRDNEGIRHFGTALFPPATSMMAGRPVANLTFALDYALGGSDVRGFHLANIFIHFLVAMALFGLVRRLLVLPPLAARFGKDASLLAAGIALVWALDPLQTEAVTYISQRTESLMALFYLFSLLCLVRANESGRARLWLAGSVAACWCGGLVKEVIATAPLMALLFDRTFFSGTFAQALRRRPIYYAAMACVWPYLIGVTVLTSERGVGMTGQGTEWQFIITSCRSLVRYVRLSLWPDPLIFDYGNDMIRTLGPALPFIVLAAGLMVSAVLLWIRRPVLGLAPAWFFGILAPSTSIIPLFSQPMAQHRLYLPLAAVAMVTVLGAYAWMGRQCLWFFAGIAAVFGVTTYTRNHDYDSELGLWRDTYQKYPTNYRAITNMGVELAKMPGRLNEAIECLEKAVRLDPGTPEMRSLLGVAHVLVPGRIDDAIRETGQAVAESPKSAKFHSNYGYALAQKPDRIREALAEFEKAIVLDPRLPEAHFNYACVLAQIPGRLPEAVRHYETALEIRPDYVEAHTNLALAFEEMPSRAGDALKHFEAAARLKPDSVDIQYNLATALSADAQRLPEAVEHFERALRLKPDDPEVLNNLGRTLGEIPGRSAEAFARLTEALRINPNLAEAHYNLGVAYARTPGMKGNAIDEFGQALKLNPGLTEASARLRELQRP